MRLTLIDRLAGNPATLPLRNLILNLVCLLALAAQLFFFVFDTIFAFTWFRLAFDGLALVMFVLVYVLIRFKRKYDWGKTLASVTGLLYEVCNFFGNGGAEGSAWQVTLLVLGILAILHEPKQALIYAGLAVVLLLACLGVEAWHPEWINAYRNPTERLLDLVITLVICGGLLVLFVLLVMHQYGESNERTRQALAVSAQTEKLAALGETMASLNHEISNPLGVMDLALSTAVAWWTQDFPQSERLWSIVPRGQEVPFWNFLQTGTASQPPDSPTRQDRARVFSARLRALGWSQVRIADQMADYFSLPWNPEWEGWLATTSGEELLASAIRFLDMVHSYRAVAAAHDRLMNLVTPLSNYSRQDSQKTPVPVRLDEGLDLVIALFVGQRNKTVEVVRQYEKVPAVTGYADELIQVWTNLIKNALSAMGDRGMLGLSLSLEGSMVVVTVDDSGPGVPDELRQQIFESFFTTKGPGKGSGLGLTIVKRIVTKHGGTVELGSSPAGGARFVVRLPVSQRTLA